MTLPDNITFNSIKENVLKYFENIKNTNVTTYFSSNSLVINLIIIYIVYIFTKDIIKGLITAILYTVVISFTIMYTYKYIDKR